jgi:hypothetical protein
LGLQHFSQFGRAKSSLNFGNQHPDCICFNYSDLQKIIYKKPRGRLEKGKNRSEKGKNLSEKGKIRSVMEKIWSVMGEIWSVMEKIRLVTEKILSEKGKIRSVMSAILSVIEEVRKVIRNNSPAKNRSELPVGKLFSNQPFISSNHPQRVLYSCRSGFQVHKTKTSARPASPVLTNALFINLNRKP